MKKNDDKIFYQDGPHKEGQQSNTSRVSGNNSRSHREMMNDREEQKAGRDHEQPESQQAADQDSGGQLGNSSSSKQ